MPDPPAGVNVEVVLAVLLNCDVEVLGPLCTDQAPVPTLGAFAPSDALPVTQMVWLLPAVAVVGVGFTVMVTLADDDAHGELLIVHVRT